MEKIYEILASLRSEFDFHESESFIQDGMLDSFDIVSLVTELEDIYGIRIDGLDILPENFTTAAAIAEVVRKNGGTL